MRSCKTSCLPFGALLKPKAARRMALQLVRLARMDFETAMNFCPAEAQVWLDEALELERELGVGQGDT